MRNGFIIDTLTSADIQQIVKFGGKVIDNYEDVSYPENFKVSSLGKFLINYLLQDRNTKMMEMKLCNY